MSDKLRNVHILRAYNTFLYYEEPMCDLRLESAVHQYTATLSRSTTGGVINNRAMLHFI